MASVDDPNSQGSDDAIAGGNPLSQGGSPAPMSNNQDTGSNMPPSGPTIQSQAPGGNMNTSSQEQASKPNRASSGMFKNIQKYVDKNKPQAQKMSSAVTQDVGKQASQIRQAAQEKQQQQQKAIQANQNIATDATSFAVGQIQDIMGPDWQADEQFQQSQVGQLINQQQAQPQAEVQPQAAPVQTEGVNPQDAVSRYRDIMEGDLGMSQISQLSLSPQQQKIRALKGLADTANTEEGRRNLLGQTFEKGRQYTRGQSALDQLILSGDEDAKRSMIEGTQQQVGDTREDLTNIMDESQQALFAHEQLTEALPGEIRGLTERTYDPMAEDINTRYQQELAARRSMTGDLGDLDAFSRELSGATNKFYSTQDLSGDLNMDTKRLDRKFKDLYGDQQLSDRLLTSLGVDPNEYKAVQAEYNRVRSPKNRERPDEYEDWDSLRQSSYNRKFFEEDRAARKALNDRMVNIASRLDQVQDFGTLSQDLSSAGYNLADISNVRDLTRADIAGQERMSQYNRLSELLGNEDRIKEDTRGEGYLSSDALRNILAKYRV